ncbi:DUF1758 domain-containing protein [Trichonephila clavipes]|nr:DUF1758 domain-containing protein [Trichonephila clavipes]
MNLGSIADELKLVVPDNAKVLDLRELIQETGQPNSSKVSSQPARRCVRGPGGSNCVVPPQGENEENKSFVATSFLKNKTRTVLLSSVQCFLRDKYGLLHEDGDVVRFLIDDGENGVQVYRFNRVLFGVNASPFLLAKTIKTHIGKYMEKYPDTVRTLDHCFYVDDLVTGEDDAKSAFDLSSKAAKIMSEAGMNLRKWISNDCELMNNGS